MSVALVAGILPPCAQFTIDFISDMDKLFDIFNSSKIPKRKKENPPFKGTEALYFCLQQGNCLNPTPIQFIWAFKKMLYLNYFQYSPGANCINDFDQILCSDEPSSSKSLILEDPNKELFMFKGML